MANFHAPARLATAAFVLAATVAVFAVGPQTGQQRRFISGVDLVTTDFFVLDGDGRHVSDLTADEVSIRIDGQTRPIRTLQYVSAANPDLMGGNAASSPLPPPYGSNAMSEAGRSILIVIDDESFRPGNENTMRSAVADFLNGLTSRDRVALLNVPHGGMKVDLTTEHARIRQALLTIVGQAPQQLDATVESCRSRDTLVALDGLMSGIRGGDSPTVVMFFSSSLLAPRRDSPINAPPGYCEVTPEHYQHVGESAASARAQFFVVMPSEVMPNPAYEVANFSAVSGSANPMEGLDYLQSMTGGDRLTLATTQSRPLERVLRETSGYYLLGFEPTESDLNGQHHGLSVSVSRPGVAVNSRPFISVAQDPAQALLPTMTPADMLREAKVFRDLPLRLTAYVSRGAVEDELQVISLGEAVQPDAAIVAASVGLYDSGGTLVRQWTGTLGDLGGRTVAAALSVAPGTYRMRLAARDADGRSGTADTEVVVELRETGSLTVSSLVLGVYRPVGEQDTTFTPRLEFTTESVAISYVEMYGGRAGAGVVGQVEVAASMDGPAFLTNPLAIQATATPNRYEGTGTIAVGSLPPGDYVVRVAVGEVVDNEVVNQTRVFRTLRKIGN